MQPCQKRNMWVLGFLLLVAGGYLGWLWAWQTLTGDGGLDGSLDGSLGVLLGLYICSHPAGNGLDLLLFTRPEAREQIAATPAGQFWLGLNALALLAGWAVIFAGVMRLVK